LATLLAVATSALADQVTLTPTKDNTIYSESNTLSNGAGIGLFAGMTKQGSTRRALLAFDVAGAVPAGSTITAAQLVLRVTMSIAGSQTTELHRLTADWGESTSNADANEGAGAPAATGDATWRYRFARTDQWATRGGDFVATASAGEPAPNSGPVTYGSTAQMVADVQGWLDAPATNFGWIVLGNEAHETTAKRFASRQATNASTRPQLVIDFQPPGGSATVTPTATVAPTETPSPTQKATDVPTQSPTVTATATATATRTDTVTAIPTATQTTSATVTLTATPTASAVLTSTPVPSDTPVPTDTPGPTASAVPSETARPTATTPATETAATPTPTMDTPLPTLTPTSPIAACVGDCDGSGSVAINELIAGVAIALGNQALAACPAFDPSGNDGVEINELIAAVNDALDGCVKETNP
jgi:hypothetical protein